MVLKSMWIILRLIILGLIIGFVENINGTQEKYTWAPVSHPGQELKRIQNLALLVTYANNIFGPSMKIKTKKEPTNITQTLYIKGYALRTPDLAKIKFGTPPINHSVYSKRAKATHPYQEQRIKRGVFNLYNMVSCATGCNPLVYMGYGCYCGFLGSGYPVDGVDRCCEMHDWCYNSANCPIFLEYIVPYFWKCYYNRPLCASDHAEFGGPGSCASRLCECDRTFSECLSRYPCPSSRVFCKSSTLRLLHNTLAFFP